MAPLVELILPTHRRPHTLPYAIRSVLLQSVGDGCDDATRDAAGVDDPRVAFHAFPKAPGFGIANRNTLLRQLAAPFVAYATDDDLLFPDHLEHGLRVLEETGAELVATRPGHVAIPGEYDPHHFAFSWKRVPFAAELRRWFVGSATLVHRRSLFERIGYWDETLSRFVDREFFRRAWRAGLAVYRDEMTVLRFYARHWDAVYPRLSEPPQRLFLDRLQDPGWRESARRAARVAPSLGARRRQWKDFFSFAMGSGPKLLRYALERLA